jgi:hypothetical protein
MSKISNTNCTCGHPTENAKHHESGCPVWEEYNAALTKEHNALRCPGCGAAPYSVRGHLYGCPQLEPTPTPEHRATAQIGDTLLCFACDGFRTKSMRDPIDGQPEYDLDHNPRPGIVCSNHDEPSHTVDIHVLMNQARDASEASGTLGACPVFEPLSEAQRSWMRQHAPTGYWAEKRPTR